MKEDNLDINQEKMELLIISKLTGDLSTDEEKELLQWSKKSEANQKLFDDFTEAWSAAQLLDGMREYDASSALKKVKGRLMKVERRSLVFTQFQRIAAVLFLPLLLALGVLLLNYKGQVKEELIFTQTIKCPPGLSSSFELTDGTKVWLSGGAEIKFPAMFSDDERRVSVIGKAFFDVKSDASKPFFVDLNDVTVQVVGTKFDVENYEDVDYVEVSLQEGKVLLYTEQNGKDGDYLTDMVPGEQVRFNRGTQKFVKTKLDDAGIGNWINGGLVFKDANIQEVIRTLEHWYNVEIIKSDDETWNSFLLTATFEDESLLQILDILKYTSEMEYKVERRKNQSGQKVIRLNKRK